MFFTKVDLVSTGVLASICGQDIQSGTKVARADPKVAWSAKVVGQQGGQDSQSGLKCGFLEREAK